MNCNSLRENYKKCFEEHGTRQCRMELDELFKCIYEREFKYSHILPVSHQPIAMVNRIRISCPDSTSQRYLL